MQAERERRHKKISWAVGMTGWRSSVEKPLCIPHLDEQIQIMHSVLAPENTKKSFMLVSI